MAPDRDSSDLNNDEEIDEEPSVLVGQQQQQGLGNISKAIATTIIMAAGGTEDAGENATLL